MERIVPSLQDIEVMATLLPRSATGQKLTTYVNIVSGPRAQEELDGAARQYVVVVDNGRSAQLGDPHFQDILHCIRCGACLNVCPVYRHIGGHAYGSVYPGPIGAVLTPLLEPTPRSAELANLSTLCGACYDACPVKIPIHDMLVQLRRRNVEQGLASATETLAMHGYSRIFRSARLLSALTSLASFLQRSLLGRGVGWLMRRFGPLRRLAEQRAVPVLAKRSFRAEWKRLGKGTPK
jgi:L-lactate dehydrogenase complex protein LldF